MNRAIRDTHEFQALVTLDDKLSRFLELRPDRRYSRDSKDVKMLPNYGTLKELSALGLQLDSRLTKHNSLADLRRVLVGHGVSVNDLDRFISPVSPADFRFATTGEYCNFLRAYLSTGDNRKPTHDYDYPFERVGFFVANRDVCVPKACGSSAFYVLVPRGIKAQFGCDGHNHGALYLSDGSVASGSRPWVPIYTDVKARLIKNGFRKDQLTPKG